MGYDGNLGYLLILTLDGPDISDEWSGCPSLIAFG